jgi:hypothetical protein
MNTKHTQGPWQINPYNRGTISTNVHDPIKSRTICMVAGGDKESAANLKLIEQAPALLETLKEIQKIIKDHEEWWMTCPDRGGFDLEKIDSIIKQATEIKQAEQQ